MKNLILILLVLIATSSFSQTSYPKKLVIDGDTVVAITSEQAKKINKTFIKANHYKAIKDSLGVKIILLEAVIQNDSIIIGNLQVQTDNLKNIIDNGQEIIDKLTEDLEATDKKLRREKLKGKLAKTVAAISLAVNVVLLLVN